MRRIIYLLLLTAMTFIMILAQDDSGGLVVEDSDITTETDAFGQEVLLMEGTLTNTNETMAYSGIDIFADVLNADGEVIGEGFGVPVNACGTGLLPDFTLQPLESQPFRITLEIFEEDAEVADVELFPEGNTVDPTPLNLSQVFTGIRGLAQGEVVTVEWVDENTLRYGVGCDADVFTNLQWYSYDLTTGTATRTTHPRAQDVTAALLEQLGLTEPTLYNRSFLTFPQGSRRIVYQTDINVMLTAEPDGSFKRLIYDDLSRRSLHGFIWMPEGRFLAYYYGAYGEDVSYFTASLEGQRISKDVYGSVPSMTIPGPTPDGSRVVITRTVEGITGYYLQNTIFEGSELLFEGDVPDNNWPAPIYAVYPGNQTFVFIMRPVDNIARLQCFDMQTRELNTLTTLPLDLTTDERAWSFLSPEGTKIALAANGVNGGLWMIDLLELNGCAG